MISNIWKFSEGPAERDFYYLRSERRRDNKTQLDLSKSFLVHKDNSKMGFYGEWQKSIAIEGRVRVTELFPCTGLSFVGRISFVGRNGVHWVLHSRQQRECETLRDVVVSAEGFCEVASWGGIVFTSTTKCIRTAGHISVLPGFFAVLLQDCQSRVYTEGCGMFLHRHGKVDSHIWKALHITTTH